VHVLEFNPAEKTIVLLINGNRYKVSLEDQYDVLLKSMGMGSNSSKKLKHLKAPMPGLVLDVLINAGDEVKKDAPLIVLEAMKMENVIKSPGEAKVSSVEVSKGAAVEKNEVLIHFE
jgi:biotin carboxyl carrier protein